MLPLRVALEGTWNKESMELEQLRMRAIKLLSLAIAFMCGANFCLADLARDKPIVVRVAAYNVEFGRSATPAQVGEMFKPYNLDIIGFNEVPDGDWTARVGKVLGMGHSYVGRISSANHKDKYKSILSRTPLEGTTEHELPAPRRRSWNPASVVRAATKIDGHSVAFYSLHICKSGADDGHAHHLATRILPKEKNERVIVVGDFNNNISDAAINTIEEAGFRPTWNDLKTDVSKRFTYNAQNPGKNLGVIDHIFYNTSAGPKSTDGGIIELKKPLSDHKPIWAEIEFPRSIGRATPLPATTKESSVTVMSYNIYRGGTMRGQPLSQTARVIREAKADVVGVQETKSPRDVTAKKLAQLLGWNCYEDHWSCILTRFEIVERIKGDRRNKGGIKVRLPSGQEAYIFNLHLPSNPYQPYQLLSIRPKWHKHWDTPFIKTEAEAIAAAKKARGGDISALLKQIRALPDKEAPVFVVGDFNEPSHLDWTEEAAGSGRHPIKVSYPNSLEMAKAGFADAWRTIYPDEMKKPGFTWTPAMKADDPETHHDRIDFVYFKGKGVKVNGAKIVGENKENADIVVSPYPSDHRAVVATFTLPNPPNSSDEPEGPDRRSRGLRHSGIQDLR
jgi:endonuclease/exonuclease/phosphatase family metal-dependent hydrolase